ncbi:hypothetical protein DPMN_134186 [Dreissena polymorpha]|uniref:Uncharacterized protein n=1 Tax=Dreissena polymorpha TaxID=45954 RepID=A0A9D4FWY2_DREPO|nr:hypothetical protein DPMN_134186 [Dreissena polymorpha]
MIEKLKSEKGNNSYRMVNSVDILQVQRLRMLTLLNSHIMKNATPLCGHALDHKCDFLKTGPPPVSHDFQQTRTIFKLIRDMFHEDWTINVTSRVLKRKTATTTGGHFFHSTGTIFELSVNKEKLPRHLAAMSRAERKTAVSPSLFNMTLDVFQPTGTIFELVQDIIRTNVLTKFHEDWTINLTSTVKTAPPPGGHVFLPTGTIFELVKDFIRTHVPTKFHDDWTKNVTSRVLTRKTATPPGTQFHEDWTINVNVVAARQTTHKRRSQKLTMSTLCSVLGVYMGDRKKAPTAGIEPCRTDGQLDGRTTPKQYPSASGGG